MKLWLMVAVRIAVGLLFIISGISKLMNVGLFSVVLKEFDLLPDSAVTLAAIIIPSVELVAGLMLVIGLEVKIASGIILALMIVFIAAIIPQLIVNNNIDCGCFGLIVQEKIGLGLLFRDLILLGLSFLCFANADQHFRFIPTRMWR